jgi:WD40 repeat protein
MSVSKILSLAPLNMAVSFSYDKRGAVWDFNNANAGNIKGRALVKQRPVDYLLGHTEPIVECILLNNSLDNNNSNLKIVSGDRSGEMKIYDLATCENILTMSKKIGKGGLLTSLCAVDNCYLFAYGGTDGFVRYYYDYYYYH